MQHLFYDWNKIKTEIKSSNLFLFLDYDGTLAMLRKTPDQAILSIKTRKLLETLSKLNNCKIAIVSGRSVRDLKQMVKLKNITYIGNHGIEIHEAAGRIHKVNQSKDLRYALFDTYKRISESLSFMEGAIIENKKYSISVHYRAVSTAYIRKLKFTVREIVKKRVKLGILKFSYGKKIIDIKPGGEWHKGSAALRLLANEKEFLPICIGDDVTDEDMFNAFKPIGITIRVGKSASSNAEYYLESITEVQDFLGYLVEIRK